MLSTMQGYLVVDHGSRRAASNELLSDVAEMVAARRPEAVVTSAHMELCEPDIAAGIEYLVAAGCDDITVLLYFLSPGRHVREDIPALVSAATAPHPNLRWRIGGALGPHPALADLLLERGEAEPAAASD